MRSFTSLIGVTFLVAANAHAQEWNWSVTPYLWTSAIDGELGLGPIRHDVDVDFSDILDALGHAALVRFEGGNDEHALIGDLVWLSLEPEHDGATTEARLDSTFFDLGYVRKLERVGLELGVRYWNLEIELDPASLAAIERDDDWVDGYVGVRFEHRLGQSWSSTTRLNVGAGGSDSTYGLDLQFARALKADNAVVIGFKLLDIDYFESSVRGIPFELDTTFLGGTIGFMFD